MEFYGVSTEIEFRVVCADRCYSTQFHCSRGNSCISAEQQCDGFTNCNDTSDEAKCCELCINNEWSSSSSSSRLR